MTPRPDKVASASDRFGAQYGFLAQAEATRGSAPPLGPMALRLVETGATIPEFELTLDDVRAFNVYHHRHSPAARRQYLRSWFIPAFLLLLACVGIWWLADRKQGTPLRTFLDLLPLFSGGPLYLLYFPWAYRRRLRKTVADMASEGENRGLFGRHRVTISAEGVAESGEFRQSLTSWRAVERVAVSDQHAYIYTNAMAAIIIPRRAFAGPAEFEEFVRTATEYHQRALA